MKVQEEADYQVHEYSLKEMIRLRGEIDKFNNGGKNEICRCNSCALDLCREINNLLDWLQNDFPNIGTIRYAYVSGEIICLDTKFNYHDTYIPRYRDWSK